MAILLAWRLGFAEYVGWLLKSQPSLKRVNLNLFFEDRAHGEPISTKHGVPLPVARIQVQIETGLVAVGRCRPVVAARANAVEQITAVDAQAGRGEKHMRRIGFPQTTYIRIIPCTSGVTTATSHHMPKVRCRDTEARRTRVIDGLDRLGLHLTSCSVVGLP